MRGLTGVRKVEDAYSGLNFASPPYRESLGVARPSTNGVEWGWKKCTDPMVAELDRVHSMTRAHPPLGHNLT